MKINKVQFKEFVENFDFTSLFNYLGWSHLNEKNQIKLNENSYNFQSVAEKGGFRILIFIPEKDQKIPEYNIRLQLDRKISRLYREHLIVFCNEKKTTQIWQLFVKQMGRPSRLSETKWSKGQEPELLYQKTAGLFFTLDEEENITIADVVERVNENFSQNVEKVTKKFYENFRKEHKAFIGFITGISEVADKEWYASLMLNRLMFCYFIQKKGFLDNNLNYLKEKLEYCQQKKGKDQFYISFYRNFLLELFHKGLGAPEHSSDFKKVLGKIPYLNGGLFDKHELEIQYADININDEAFIKVFNFFDTYNWHLDTRTNASGNDVNPDVIGYIFEKYINDRAQMGAYYTKEDITDYISKNCIIPFLFDETSRNLKKPFDATGEIWTTMKESGDAYIYDAVKYGIPADNLWADLPEEVIAGLDPDQTDLVEKRKCWNKPAPADVALPTEIYREVIDRRKRYAEIKDRIANGEVAKINDLITYNLNITQFATDVIQNTDNPELVHGFYKTLEKMTILDPTCGSGAFLFAAMNILESLYETCIERMRAFTLDEDLFNQENKKNFSNKFESFRKILSETQNEQHPNLKYFIYKKIILNNLYGVDIMKEAVEIAKLRMFLKLVATVDADFNKPNLGLEPLPDIDFNIRSGNTLVGFASYDEAIRAIHERDKNVSAKQSRIDLVFEQELTVVNAVKEKAELVSMAFARFKDAQLIEKKSDDFRKAKDDLNLRLKDLNNVLNIYQAFLYAVDKDKKPKLYDQWLETHQPFHWFAEFYEIIQGNGGFDVIIGNPPYVEYSSIRKTYQIKNYACLSSSNLYSFVIERAISIQKDSSYNGMIIPLSAYCTDRMASFQKVEFENCSELFLSFYAERPSKLFEGAERNLVISLFKKRSNTKIERLFTTYYYKWNSSFRKYLFENISYTEAKETIISGIVPKISSEEELSIIKTLRSFEKNIGNITAIRKTDHSLFYRNSGGRYWKIITTFQPKFFLNGNRGVSSRESYLYFNDLSTLKIITALLNSSTYYWYYIMHSDARTNNPSDLKCFPIVIDDFTEVLKEKLIFECDRLMKDLDINAIMQAAKYRTGNVEFQQFYPQKSKLIIDEIDTALANHFGFTQEELDFIINYDIKYRMGSELESGEEE